uniref:Uncharacterized protein n=1 Tax=Cucumis melo TaxID=3656 RepID=A0A9I9EDJ5_CUCME
MDAFFFSGVDRYAYGLKVLFFVYIAGKRSRSSSTVVMAPLRVSGGENSHHQFPTMRYSFNR